MSQQPWSGLQLRFLRLVIPGPADWRAVWELIVTDHWYQDQLAACAYQLAHRRNTDTESPDDVQQEAMSLLGRQLCKESDLGIDWQRADLCFAPWMRGIIYHSCREGLRRLRRTRRRVMSLPEGMDFIDARSLTRAEYVDLGMAIETLKKPARTILQLRLKGFNRREIARQMGREYSGLRRDWKAALEALRELLGDEEYDRLRGRR